MQLRLSPRRSAPLHIPATPACCDVTKGIEVVKRCHFERDRGRLLRQGHSRAAVGLAVVAILCACAVSDSYRAAKSRTPLTSTIENLGMSPQELRIRVRALLRPTLGILEETADTSVQDVDEPEVHRAAVRWKIETTTTLLSAMLRNDPLLALLDAWGYVFQVENFLATPEAARYGALAPQGTAAMEQIRGSFLDLARNFPADLSGEVLEAKLRTWAERNPIEGRLYRRPSIDAALAGILASPGTGGAFAALGRLEETTSDVMMRMDLYTMYLPRLARWEAELAVGDLAQGSEANRLIADVEQLTRAADRLAAVAEGMSDLVARERAATLDVVRGERLAATRDLQEERVAALAEVEAIAQRLLDHSRGPLQEAARMPLEEVVRSIEKAQRSVIDDGGVTLESVVDHAFIRSVQLLLIAATLAALGVILYARFLRRR